MKICKKFFSGFCFKNEEELFKAYIKKSDFTVCGFSYGAIKAIEYALNTNERIDTLQLFSPAFFIDKDKKFIRTQLMYFKKDKITYIEGFLKNVKYPVKNYIKNYFFNGNLKELEELLSYDWSPKILDDINKKNIKIEIYLGQVDKIINADAAKDYFINYATVYYLKNKGHLL